MRILNLYAGIGGNRKLWKNHEITAVEINPEIAAVYKELYPNDKVIVGNANQYLLENYKDFDFIWSSPPCQSHSSFRHNIGVKLRGTKPAYPDMTLYQEIIFLKHHFQGKWIVENVKPYYQPLIAAQQVNRHLYWANFEIGNLTPITENLRTLQIPGLQKLHDVNLDKYKISNKRQVLRNCVHYLTGQEILEKAML